MPITTIPVLYLNHCTGERALADLAKAFAGKVHPCPAGTLLVFD
jgi:metal-dependent hydrolase (beta-lactamase superfamily II)